MRDYRAQMNRVRAYMLVGTLHQVSVKYGVSKRLLLGRNRERRITEARHELWARIYGRPGWSYSLVAELFELDTKSVHEGVRAALRRRGRAFLARSVTGGVAA